MSIDGEKITSAATISDHMKKQKENNREITLSVKRGEIGFSVVVLPVLDAITNDYKLGLWIRGNSAGVGILIYVLNQNKLVVDEIKLISKDNILKIKLSEIIHNIAVDW